MSPVLTSFLSGLSFAIGLFAGVGVILRRTRNEVKRDRVNNEKTVELLWERNRINERIAVALERIERI